MNATAKTLVGRVVTFTAPVQAVVILDAAGHVKARDDEGRCWEAPAEAVRVVEAEG